MKHIKETSVPYDESKKAKLHIKIINHAFPLIQLAPNAVIYQDNTPIFKSDQLTHSIIDRPKTIEYKHIQLYEHIVDKKPTVSRVSECTLDIVANQWCMLYWCSYFNGPFIHFCSEEKLGLHYYTEKKEFQLLPHSPGGISNMGNFNNGEDNEFFIEEDGKYELNIIISPAIKIKSGDYIDHERYPNCIYPFIKGREEYNPKSYYHPVLHVDIIEGDDLNVYNNCKWENEHNFGIDVNLKNYNKLII
jgi:hypothetical protein